MIEVGTDGQILWEHPVPGLAVMFEMQKNGNVMYAYGGSVTGVQEVDRKHNVVWNYTAKMRAGIGVQPTCRMEMYWWANRGRARPSR